MSAQAPHLLIAGGGMVGLSLALMLDAQLPENARITLVEGVALPDSDTHAPAYHPSFDARSTALSYSSARFYRELGIWDQLQAGLGTISSIHVSRRGRFGSSLLSAADQGWEALGWVVENPCLGRTLLAAARQRPRIQLHCPARVTDAAPLGTGMRVSLGEQTKDVDLLIIADGAESALRDKLGFFTQKKLYGQHALIANLAFEGDHAGCAYERFTTSGPLALLPLPDSAQSANRMALVWSLNPEEAEQLQGASDPDFSSALLHAFGHRLGRVTRVGDRQAYPLTLTDAREQVRRGCIVLGNAAHALHPVAGQGFNLALRDAALLAETLAGAVNAEQDPGDVALLDVYMQARAQDQGQTIAASDGLPTLFMSRDPLLSLARDLALSGLDFVPGLRRQFVRQAAGMAAVEVSRGR
ncbi:MAG: 2-octaprenyl-6-methoxyphenyl hydroxylase [Congregibacter sp.]